MFRGRYFQLFLTWITVFCVFMLSTSVVDCSVILTKRDLKDLKTVEEKDIGFHGNGDANDTATISTTAATEVNEATSAGYKRDILKGEKLKHHWGYKNDGDLEWKNEAKECGGISQSPIDIVKSKVVMMATINEIIYNTNYKEGGAKLKNNGHTVSVVLNDKTDLVWEKLPNPYQVQGFHFHWGKHNTEGSEHAINGIKYPLEMHIVSFNHEKYGTIMESLGGEDSLAVYGVLFKLSPFDNKYLDPIIGALKEADESGEEIPIKGFNLTDLLPGHYSTRYYTYSGSLTTPPCSENVAWVVGHETLSLSSKQLDELRKLSTNPGWKHKTVLDKTEHGEDRMDTNWRRTQNINERIVFSTYPDYQDAFLKDSGLKIKTSWFLCSVSSIIVIVGYIGLI